MKVFFQFDCITKSCDPFFEDSCFQIVFSISTTFIKLFGSGMAGLVLLIFSFLLPKKNNFFAKIRNLLFTAVVFFNVPCQGTVIKATDT